MLDSVLLGLVSAAAFVGFYSFAVKLIRLSALALTDTLLVFFPHAVALLHNRQKEKFQQIILRNIELLTLFSVPIGAGVFLLSDEIVAVFFGSAFRQVSLDLKILAPIPFLKCYNLFLSKQVLISYDKEKLYMRALLGAGLLFIIATLILSYFFRDLGASYAMVIYETSLLAFNYYYVRKTDNSLRIFVWKTMAQAAAGAILFIPIVFMARSQMDADWLRLCVIIVLATLVYILFQLYVVKNGLMVDLRKSGLQLITHSFQRDDKA